MPDASSQAAAPVELTAAGQFLAAVMNAIPTPVFVKDEQYRIVFCNDAFCATLGRPRDALLGRTDFDLVPAEEARFFQEQDAVVFATGQPHETEEALTDAACVRHWLLTRKSIVHLPDGSRYLVGVISDITARKRAEEQLADSERQKSTVIASSLDPIITIDSGGRILDFNPAAERTFGHARADVLGKVMAEIIIPDRHRAAHNAGLARYLSSGIAQILGRRIELTALRSDGTVFPVELAVTATSLNNAQQFTAFLRDITERKLGEVGLRDAKERAETAEQELARARAQLVDSIEVLPAGFVLYDGDDRLVLTNSTYTTLYGGKVDPPGTRFEDALRISLQRGAYPSAIGREEEWLAERMAQRRAASGSFEQQLTNGRWLRVIERRTSDGGTVGIRIDITESKLRELELHRAKEQAEAASRTKSEFLANMSHELRTPLNAVIGFSEVMCGEMLGPMAPRYRDYAKDIHASGRHLLELINDVLDLSKAESGQLELTEENVEIEQLVQATLRFVRERAEKGRIDLQADLPAALPMLLADGRKVKQILLNLLSNAIKFTPAGGRVALSVSHTASDVCFHIVDTGIGMRPEDIPVALQPFRQLDGSLSRSHEGTGLGLPLAKRLVTLHGGALEITSEPGKGTAVTVRLPKRREIAAA